MKKMEVTIVELYVGGALTVLALWAVFRAFGY